MWGERPQQSKCAFSTAQPPLSVDAELRGQSGFTHAMSASQTGENASQKQSFVQKISPRSLPANRTRQSRLVISLKISGHFMSLNNNKKNAVLCSMCNESNSHSDGSGSTGRSHRDLSSADAAAIPRADRSRFVQAHSPSPSGDEDATLRSGNVGATMLFAFPPQPALGPARPSAPARREFYSLGSPFEMQVQQPQPVPCRSPAE